MLKTSHIKHNKKKRMLRKKQHLAYKNLRNKKRLARKHSRKARRRRLKKEERAVNNNQRSIRLAALLIGLLVNIFGNSLTIVSNMGAEPWTSAAVGLSKLTSLSVGKFIIAFGIINAILNQVLISEDNKISIRKPKSFKDTFRYLREMLYNFVSTFSDKYRFIEEILYIFIFGDAVDVFTWGMEKIGMNDWNFYVRIGMSITGVTLFCIAISIYQRANIFMHPNDDTSNLIRYKFFNGSAIKSQIADIIPALGIILICWLILKAITPTSIMNSLTYVDFGIGTIYSIIANGFIVKYSDRWIWPSLTHNTKKHHFF